MEAMTITPNCHPKTVAIVCSTCGTKIADAVPGALAKCPHCQTWSGTTERPRLPRRHSPWDRDRGVVV
jgi:DNA-directed RNA polymerase subunit RPC12/RpoP